MFASGPFLNDILDPFLWSCLCLLGVGIVRLGIGGFTARGVTIGFGRQLAGNLGRWVGGGLIIVGTLLTIPFIVWMTGRQSQ